VPPRRTCVRPTAATVALVLLLSGCATDHGAALPDSATDAVDCDGAPYRDGHGNYDSGPETVQDAPDDALEDWLDEEGSGLPDVEYAETARHDGSALFTWTSGRSVLAAFVVRDGTADAEGGRGWGVGSYAVATRPSGHRRPATLPGSRSGPTPRATECRRR
jgi:hypothetical protein